MKKLIAIFLAIAMLAALSGCAGTTVVVGNCTCPPADADNTPAATEAPAEGALKTGLAVVATGRESVGATAEASGKAKYDVTLAAVTVDENGIIRACALDSIGAEVVIDAAGLAVDFDPNAEILTKNELGDGYNMKLYAGSKYEWYEQAAAVAEYAVGKTAEQLRTGAVNESGYAGDADLATTATIYIGGYVDAIAQAAENAQHLGAQAGDVLKLAAINALTATPAEAGGSAIELTVDVTALTMNGETITSCHIDSLQAKLAFDGTGALTTDLSVSMQTKNELGDGYNMKAWGGAKYEWYEQAANFAAYATGKTVTDIWGIAVAESGKPADGTDLAASVTITVGGFQKLIEKAAQ